MPRLINAPNCLGLFIQIFVGYSPLLLWATTNISSHSLMIIPHYGFAKLIREKSASLEAFKAFKSKVELQIPIREEDQNCLF